MRQVLWLSMRGTSIGAHNKRCDAPGSMAPASRQLLRIAASHAASWSIRATSTGRPTRSLLIRSPALRSSRNRGEARRGNPEAWAHTRHLADAEIVEAEAIIKYDGFVHRGMGARRSMR